MTSISYSVRTGKPVAHETKQFASASLQLFKPGGRQISAGVRQPPVTIQ